MGKVTILGSAYSVPDLEHGNTHLLVETGSSTILIDCAGDVIQRLQRININMGDITDLIITHFHPDHTAGVPLFLMDCWVTGRRLPLNLRGLHHTLDRIKTNMDLYSWQEWPEFYPLYFLPFEMEESTLVHETPELKITASPVKHFMPTVCLRLNFVRSGKSLLYSSDTAPCPAVENLARDVDVLIHESTGDSPGHTSAAQAAKIAHQAGAKSLYLIHYPPHKSGQASMIAEAQSVYNGPIQLARDFMSLDFN